MSIELVDKIDQAKSGRRYQKVGRLNDLFLHDEEGSVSSRASEASDYVGLELETVMEKQQTKKQSTRLVIGLLCISMLIAIGVYISRENNASPAAANGGNNLRNPNNDDDHMFGQDGTSNTHTSGGGGTATPTKDEGDDSESSTVTTTNTWPTSAPLRAFDICMPKMHFTHHNKRIHHLYDLKLVPEDKSSDNDDEQWQYTFSAMDIDEMASIIAVGLSDFGRSQEYLVGMVRAFAFDCHTKKFKQLGQDLLGGESGDGFGYALSSSKDGKVMAVSAVQDNDAEDSNGYVQVYYLDGNVWTVLGQRIEELEDSEEYYNLGSAIDLSDNGETLAILGIVSDSKFVTRIFEYDVNEKKWTRKGHDLVIEVDSSNESWWSFKPRVSLSEDGDELSLLDPKMGLIKYHFEFEKDKWTESESKMPTFNADHWVEGLDFDESGDLIAFSAYDWATTEDETTQHMAKVVDFSDGVATEIYNKTVADVTVGINIAVSQDGTVAAIVESKIDMDDTVIWEYDDVGALTIISKNNDGVWKVLGKDGECEEMGVPGSYVTLSGDGTIAAVGTDSIVSLYYISLNHAKDNSTSSSTEDSTTEPDDGSTPTVDVTITDDPDNLVPNTTVAENATLFEICAPFPKLDAQHVGDLDDLPKQPDEHSLSISLSGDASIVAVGIDSFEDEDRGMVRVFAWDCAKGNYSRLGQDLFGVDEFDGFGQSVDVSNDGKTLVVGANQPPPGKAGYVDIYHFTDDGLWAMEDRFEEVKDSVEDIGREVRISSDGSTVAIHGSFVDAADGGYLNSFIRIIEKSSTDGKWKNKGDDLVSSIAYDDYGTSVKLSFAADGKVLGVTGSYNTFMAKMYTFDDKKSNWTELSIPPIKSPTKDDADDESYFDEYCSEYFDGSDIALSDDGESVAISGTQWSTSTAVVRILKFDSAAGNWTMSHDAVDYDTEYSTNSIGISGDAKVLAVGINTNDDTKDEQGTLYVSQADDSDRGWKTLGSIDGRDTDDLLGSRISVSSDGSLAAASSKKGYVSFFKTGV
jgi:hypothetical protein